MRRRHRAHADLLRRSSPGSGQRVPRSVPGDLLDGSEGAGDARRPAPRLLVICGPTGTGKTEVAIRLARRLDGEIVGCDALQVYRGLDVATAKPTPAERRLVPHHLVDVVDPSRNFTLAEWVRDAERAAAGIAERGRVPVVVGGTGLYLRGLLRGVVPAPPVDAGLRRRLRRMAGRYGDDRMHRWLGALDPASARRLPPRDVQRVLRAIELALSGQGTWSQRLERDGTWDGESERYPTLKIGLDMDRERLDLLLERRIESFFASGLVEETRALLDAGVPPESNALKAIGYREVVAAFRDGADPRDARERIVRNTRRYSRRQRTWFRGEPGIVWLDAAAGAEALALEVEKRWQG